MGRVRRGRRPGQGPRSSVPPSAPQLCVHDNYRNNPFHNFRHCFCVTQMMYSMIWLCGLQVGPRGPPRGAGELPPGTAPRRPPCPPESGRCGGFVLPVWPIDHLHPSPTQEKFSQMDILVLMTAAICHDLDHPGYNNTYVPLSL